eukprot:315587_1
MSAYRTKSRSLSDELIDVNTENERLKSQNSLHREEIEIHKTELEDSKKIIEELKHENDLLKEKTESLTQHLKHYNDLRNRLDTMYHTNIHLNSQINKFKQHIQQYENTNKQLSETVQLFERRTTQHETENALNKKEIGNHRENSLKQKELITELQDELETLQSQLISVQTYDTNIFVEDEKDFEIEIEPKFRRKTMEEKQLFGQTMAAALYENSNKTRSDSIWSVQSQYTNMQIHQSGSYIIRNEIYEDLVTKYELLEKECKEQKQQLHKQMNIIKQLRGVNTKLGKRLSKDSKRCYIFDLF